MSAHVSRSCRETIPADRVAHLRLGYSSSGFQVVRPIEALSMLNGRKLRYKTLQEPF